VTAPHVRIGTRASQLAQWQANWVADELRKLGATVELVEISTSGDVQQVGPIVGIGLQGVFTKEIQAELLGKRVDVAVHSLKDLPTETVDGLVLAAVPARESSSDALVSNTAQALAELPVGARVGTGSHRRQAQLRNLRSDLQVVGIRGNVDTRLRKLDEGQYDAIILAEAGLRRLGWENRIRELLEPPRMLPAPGQGALGLECREGDSETQGLLAELDHRPSHQAVAAERAMLALLHAGCSAPVGAWGRIEGAQLVLDGLVANLEGTEVLRASARGLAAGGVELGRRVAEELLKQGAAALVEAARDA
jgi:hydroxymethylbilane synthase